MTHSYILCVQSNRRHIYLIIYVCVIKQKTIHSHKFCVCSETADITLSKILCVQSNRRHNTPIHSVCAIKQMTYRSHTICVCNQTDDKTLPFICLWRQTDFKTLSYILRVQSNRWHTALIHSVFAGKQMTLRFHTFGACSQTDDIRNHTYFVKSQTGDIPLSYI